MINMKPGKDANDGRGHAGAGMAGSGQDYQSRLASILAKAGGQAGTPAAGQAPAPSAQPAAPAGPPQTPATQAPSQAGASVPQPAPAAHPVPGPAASAPQAQPQDPSQRLQQILAMAGQTPVQRAQAQAQQAQANNAAAIMGIVQNYIQAVSQDPRRILLCDIEFSANPGANTDIYFKCYADQAGNVYWDAFGDDISYVIPAGMGGYQLLDNYFRGIPADVFQADMATARVHSHQIV